MGNFKNGISPSPTLTKSLIHKKIFENFLPSIQNIYFLRAKLIENEENQRTLLIDQRNQHLSPTNHDDLRIQHSLSLVILLDPEGKDIVSQSNSTLQCSTSSTSFGPIFENFP